MKPIHSSSISRRQFIKMAILGGGGLLTACNLRAQKAMNALTPVPTDSLLPTAAFTNAPYIVPTNTFEPVPTETPAPTEAPGVTNTPGPTRTPEPTRPEQKINTVIYLILENKSFDSIFAGYPGTDSQEFEIACTDTIPDKIYNFREPTTPFACTYRKELVPNFWKLAEMFTLCDNFYTEVKGPSIPNYQMMTGAQFTTLVDPPTEMKCPEFCVDFPVITDIMDERKITWADYGGMLASINHLVGRPEIHYNDIGNFFGDVESGNMQNFIMVNAALYGGDKISGHPPGSMCESENFTMNLISKVMYSPQWPSTMLILTWDDWGGFYDHVIPPWVESLPNGEPLRYGNRVPTIVVSPYSRQGYVSHTVYSFTSMLKTLEVIFGLRSLNFRDEKANSLLDCLDFNQEPIKPDWIDLRDCGTQ